MDLPGLLSQFVDSGFDRRLVHSLRNFLTAPPRKVDHAGTCYVDDVDERLEFCRMVESSLRADQKTPFLWSMIMIMPITRLRQIRDEIRNSVGSTPSSRVLPVASSQLEILLKIFLTKDRAVSDPPPHPARSLTEADKCRTRDKYCVLCLTATPHVCRIIPFSSMERGAKFSSTLDAVIGVYWNVALCDRLQGLLTGNGNIVDSTKNMICLSPLLHHWWRKAYFALEPYERLPNGIRVRFRWLKKSRFKVHQTLDSLDHDPRTCLQEPDQQGFVEARIAGSGHPILDGTLIDLIADTAESQVSWDLMQLQYDLLRMSALSGAGEASNDPSWVPDDDSVWDVETKMLAKSAS